jgi:pectinesterase inhibitor-like protein
MEEDQYSSSQWSANGFMETSSLSHVGGGLRGRAADWKRQQQQKHQLLKSKSVRITSNSLVQFVAASILVTLLFMICVANMVVSRRLLQSYREEEQLQLGITTYYYSSHDQMTTMDDHAAVLKALRGGGGGGDLQLHSRSLKQSTSSTVVAACAATRYPVSCLAALNADPRSTAAVPRDLVGIAIGVALTHATTGVADSATLASQLVGVTGNPNLSQASSLCTQVMSLAQFHLQNSENAVNGPLLNDVQAWLSGSLTFVTDCSAALHGVSNLTPFATQMTVRMDSTVQLASNALAMTDALVTYGDNVALWKPPPAGRQEMLAALLPSTSDAAAASGYPGWVKQEDRHLLDRSSSSRSSLLVATPSVTVSLGSALSSIQTAVNLAPDWSATRYVIHITAGVYTETVVIPRSKTNLMFLGDGVGSTIITGFMSDSQPGMDTWSTATVAVNAANFIAQGVTFRNTAGPTLHQAVALRVNGDQAAFQNCLIDGYQDSLYAHSLRQFYRDTTIMGTVDFVFGNAAALFQDCTILVRAGAPGATTSTITAQGRTDPGQTTGLVFQNCSVLGTLDYLALYQADPAGHQAFLGRPWKIFSRTIFIDTYLGQIIAPTGWLQWDGNYALATVFDGEIGSYGPGATNLQLRVNWSNQLTLQQAQAFSVNPFIQGASWLPQTGIPFNP